MRIGVLAVQGAFIEHIQMISNISASYDEEIECFEIRQAKDLQNIDGLILPGGESTVQGKLIKDLGMFDSLHKMIQDGLPTLATCAGVILLARDIENDATHHLSTLPVTIKRNAYGRQLGSYMTNASVGDIKDYPLVFIRAPYITDVDSDVKVLTKVDSNIVAVEYNNQIGLSFHPEMTKDDRIHRYFIDKIISTKNKEYSNK